MIDKENRIIEFAGAKNPLLYMKERKLYEIKGDIYSVGGWVGDDDDEITYHAT
ncbi:MAG: hypothetical protein HC880_11730 [Bacteroidia bacterium]|nr:hypothetical protein [Bacteroidia bacterium]